MGNAWKPLKQGDIIDIVAPAYGTKEKHLVAAEGYIRSLGLVPRTPDDLHGDHLFCSNSDAIRLQHLKEALYAEDSAAIWCLKGGYGTSPLIPELMSLTPPQNIKLVIGFSDITALHLFLTQQWNWHSLHGPVLWQIATDRIDENSLKHVQDTLFGNREKHVFTLEKKNHSRSGIIESVVAGGNLMLLSNSIGTGWQIDAKNKLLLLEEVDEKPYRVDRMLVHLQQAGIFDHVKGVLLADFSTTEELVPAMNEALDYFIARLSIPVFRLSGVGHNSNNRPVPLNSPATIEVTPKNSILTIDSGHGTP